MSLDIVDWLDAEGTPEAHAARDEIERLRQLAASLLNDLLESQAREKVLRDELIGLRGPYGFGKDSTQEAALSMSSDDTALKAALKNQRERCAKVCEQQEVHEVGHPGTAFKVQGMCIDAIRSLGD